MSEKEMINNVLDVYANLQRLKSAENYEEELDYQIKLAEAKLESFGIVTTKLERTKK